MNGKSNGSATARNPVVRFIKELRLKLALELAVLALGALMGLLFASGSFDNATYMATLDSGNPSIGPRFGTKLILKRVETLVTPQPLCTFEAGNSGDISIARGGDSKQVGPYLVEVKECDPQRKFAVIYARRTNLFYKIYDKIWSAFGL
jgi:hypothetical protein